MNWAWNFYEICYGNYAYFYVDIIVLHLGGPEFCQGVFPSNFTFNDSSSPEINITLCGVPQPKVEATFAGKEIDFINATVNSYTHTYTLQLPKLSQTLCGELLQVTAKGYSDTLTDKTQIFVKNCKYDIMFILFLFCIICNKLSLGSSYATKLLSRYHLVIYN